MIRPWMTLKECFDLRRAAVVVLMAGSLAGAVSVPLGAQVPPAREQARSVMPSSLFADVDALATEADRRGIPPEPIFNKALEGMAKRVPPPLLLTALRGYSQRLGTTREAFGPGATSPLLVAGADALQRGVTPDDLRQLGQGENRSPMAVLVLADLIETGVPSDRALNVLHEAMGQRMREQRMLEIPQQVRQFMRAGHSPTAAAERVWARMRRGMGGGGGSP